MAIGISFFNQGGVNMGNAEDKVKKFLINSNNPTFDLISDDFKVDVNRIMINLSLFIKNIILI